MDTTTPACPRCSAAHGVRDGDTHSGRPSFRCRSCGRRFVADPAKGPVSEARKELVRRPLSERPSPRAVARVTGLSRPWLQAFVSELYRERAPREPGPLKRSRATS